MHNTLVLDQGYRPLKIVSWQRAVTLLYQNKIELVEEYADCEIRAVSITIKMPAVVRLLNAVRRTKRSTKFSRLNILTRDKFACQYCGRRKSFRELNYDHVVPRSQGGKTTWTNIVACCIICNQRKGGRTPEQAGMRLLSKPRRPEELPLTALRFEPGTKLPDQWRSYVYWRGALEETP